MAKSFIGIESVDPVEFGLLVAGRTNPALKEDATKLAVSVNKYAERVELNARLILAVVIHETGRLTSARYRLWKNPGGIAISSNQSKEVWRPYVPSTHEAGAMIVAAIAQKVLRRSVRSEIPSAYLVTGMEAWLSRSLSFVSHRNYPSSTKLTSDMTKRFVDNTGETQFVWAEDQHWDEGVDGWYDLIKPLKESPVSLQKVQRIPCDLTPWGRSNRDGDKLDLKHGGLRITLHDTDNKQRGTGALRHANWQDQLGPNGGVAAGVGVHLYVDDFGFTQKLPLDEIGYHAGDGCNDVISDTGCFRSVSIEMCVNADSDHLKMHRNAAMLIAMIANQDPVLDWGGGTTKGKFSIERIDQHRWVTQSNDPHDCPHSLRHADYGVDWNEFLGMVDEAWKFLTTKKPQPGPYGKATIPAFMKRVPLPVKAVYKGVTFHLDPSYWVAEKQTPVLVAASRKAKSTRRPVTVGEAVKILYRGDGGSEQWGINRFGSRIPLRDMKRRDKN